MNHSLVYNICVALIVLVLLCGAFGVVASFVLTNDTRCTEGNPPQDKLTCFIYQMDRTFSKQYECAPGAPIGTPWNIPDTCWVVTPVPPYWETE